MGKTAIRFRRPSASEVERSLAGLLVALLGTYVLGTIVGDAVPALDTAGVIAVHLAVVVACTFPLAVLAHAASGRVRTGATSPRAIEVVTAVAALGCLVAALWLVTDPTSGLDTYLFASAAGALSVLAGLVAGRP